jgi:hypothetical protein
LTTDTFAIGLLILSAVILIVGLLLIRLADRRRRTKQEEVKFRGGAGD